MTWDEELQPLLRYCIGVCLDTEENSEKPFTRGYSCAQNQTQDLTDTLVVK